MKVRKFCQETKKPGPCKGQKRSGISAAPKPRRLKSTGKAGQARIAEARAQNARINEAVRESMGTSPSPSSRLGGITPSGAPRRKTELKNQGYSLRIPVKPTSNVASGIIKPNASYKNRPSSILGTGVRKVLGKLGIIKHPTAGRIALLRGRNAGPRVGSHAESFAEDFYLEIDMDVLPGRIV